MGCDIKGPEGKPCEKPAVHQWGPVKFCCDHFSQFVEGMFDLKDAVQQRHHEEWVRLYEIETGRRSRILDMLCDPTKRKDSAK
jgi:hypothetical protein